jgi:hypothetical protein
MPKKTFKKVADDNPALAFLGKQDGQAIHDAHDIHNVQTIHTGQGIDYVDYVDDVHDGHNVHVVHDVYHVYNDQDVHNVDAGHSVDAVHETALVKYTHINLRVTQETKAFLSDESWKSRMNITQYINALIQSDMDAKRAGRGDGNI